MNKAGEGLSVGLEPGARIEVVRGKKKGETGVIIPDTERVCCNGTVLLELDALGAACFGPEDLKVLGRVEPRVDLEKCRGCIFLIGGRKCGRYSFCRGKLLQREGGRIPLFSFPVCQQERE